MNLYSYIVFVVILVFIGGLFYIRRRNRLATLMNLELEYTPDKVMVGETVDFFVHATPEKTIKAESVEGDLICRQYGHPWMIWAEDLGISGLNLGQPVTIIAFSMGRDMVFVKGTRSTYGGYLPIPIEAHASSMEKYNLIRWTVTVRIHAPGYSEASIRSHLEVEPLRPGARQKTVSQEKTAIPVDSYASRHRTRERVMVVVDGDTRDDGSKEISESCRFSFLEISDERQEN